MAGILWGRLKMGHGGGGLFPVAMGSLGVYGVEFLIRRRDLIGFRSVEQDLSVKNEAGACGYSTGARP